MTRLRSISRSTVTLKVRRIERSRSVMEIFSIWTRGSCKVSGASASKVTLGMLLMLVQHVIRYPDYEITWSNDGY